MRSSLTLTVEVDPGTSIETAFIQAVTLSKWVGIDVSFKFNGVVCNCNQNSNVTKGVKAYHDALTSKDDYKYANA